MKPDIKQMLNDIDDEARCTEAYTGRKHFSKHVMTAMSEVLRENFVNEFDQYTVYANAPMPIGCGQTISQPYIVALMTDLLDLTPDSRVLEVGTGSGYQAAILSVLASKVYSIERVPELYKSSSERLKKLGYSNIETRCGNGYYGWPEKAPYDAIIVTAAATHVPETLVEQLKPGGRMVVPVGLPYMHQELIQVDKQTNGSTKTKSLLAVAFVPLKMDETKGENWQEIIH